MFAGIKGVFGMGAVAASSVGSVGAVGKGCEVGVRGNIGVERNADDVARTGVFHYEVIPLEVGEFEKE
ncbi:MAG: hypothetical protein U0M50_04210 [Paramuribaculum sp.]